MSQRLTWISGGELDLVSNELAIRLIDRPSRNPSCEDDVIVNLEEPQASLLLRTIAPERFASFGSESCQPARMPLASEVTVSDEDVDCIEDWVRGLDRPEPQDDDPSVPADAITVLTKVKYLLHGGAPSRAELDQASDERGALVVSELEALVERWMQSPEYKIKRRQFLELTLQQTPVDGNYYNCFVTRGPILERVRTSLQESLIRTAERSLTTR